MTNKITIFLRQKTEKNVPDLPLSAMSTGQLTQLASSLGISRPNYTNIFGWEIHNKLLECILGKIPEHIRESSCTQVPDMWKFYGKNVLTDYNYRSGWYAIRVVSPHELHVANYIWQLCQKNTSIKVPQKTEKVKDPVTGQISEKITSYIEVPLFRISDVAYPKSFNIKDYKNVEMYRGYIFIKFDFDDLDNQQSALVVEAYRKFLLTIEKAISFVGFAVEEKAFTTEQVVSFASGKQKLNTFKKHIVLPSKAKDREIKALENSHANFSINKKPDFSEGFICHYLTDNGNYRKVVVTSVRDNDTYMIRYVGDKGMPSFPVKREYLFTRMEKKLAALAS